MTGLLIRRKALQADLVDALVSDAASDLGPRELRPAGHDGWHGAVVTRATARLRPAAHSCSERRSAVHDGARPSFTVGHSGTSALPMLGPGPPGCMPACLSGSGPYPVVGCGAVRSAAGGSVSGHWKSASARIPAAVFETGTW